jgi:hypothetical protein
MEKITGSHDDIDPSALIKKLADENNHRSRLSGASQDESNPDIAQWFPKLAGFGDRFPLFPPLRLDDIAQTLADSTDNEAVVVDAPEATDMIGWFPSLAQRGDVPEMPPLRILDTRDAWDDKYDALGTTGSQRFPKNHVDHIHDQMPSYPESLPSSTINRHKKNHQNELYSDIRSDETSLLKPLLNSYVINEDYTSERLLSVEPITRIDTREKFPKYKSYADPSAKAQRGAFRLFAKTDAVQSGATAMMKREGALADLVACLGALQGTNDHGAIEETLAERYHLSTVAKQAQAELDAAVTAWVEADRYKPRTLVESVGYLALTAKPSFLRYETSLLDPAALARAEISWALDQTLAEKARAERAVSAMTQADDAPAPRPTSRTNKTPLPPLYRGVYRDVER